VREIGRVETAFFLWKPFDIAVAILGYGEVDIEIQGLRGKEIFCLVEVAYCKDFACNLVSLRQLHKHGLCGRVTGEISPICYQIYP